MHIFPQRASLQELGNDIFKLVSYSATPEQWAEWLRVPLEHAAARGNLDLVNILLQAGADGSAGWRGCRGRTLLHAAAVGGNPDVLTALLGAGAQPDVNIVSLSPKRSALYVATACGHVEVASRLIQAGADVRFMDPVEQLSVLHEAARGCHEQLVNELLIGGADSNSLFGPFGSTPLHHAAIAGHSGIISALLLRGANKDALDLDGATPLMWATGEGQLDAVETLLAAGADYNIRDVEYDDSALDAAACDAHIPVLKALVGHRANVNFRDCKGLSALHKAAIRDQARAIDALIDAGADIDLKSNNGGTPLFLAAYYSCSKSMLTLLKRGAEVMMRDEFESSHLHHACVGRRPGLEKAVDLLLRWGADETALSIDGLPPVELLDHDLDESENRCSQEEVERARLLLAHAPADRAWRRRGWLVMLRSRASKVEVASHGTSGGCSNVAGIQETEGQKTSGTEVAAGVQHDDTRWQRSRGGEGEVGDLLGVGAGDGADSNGSSFNGVVALLLGLELEGVFRTVVGFL